MVQIEGLDKLLREHPFFQGFDDDARTLLAGCAANERFDAGTYLFREGGSADKFYLVRSGAIALEFHDPGQQPVVLETVGEGEVIGWSWLLAPYKWHYDARAVQLTRVVSLDAACLRSKCDADPALGYTFMKHFLPVVAKRLAAARLQMVDMYANPKTRRT